MGGNALANVKSIRLEKKLYKSVEEDITKRIEQVVTMYAVLHYCTSKTDFGDVDIIVVPKDNSKFREEITKIFAPRDMVSHGNVLSVDYDLNKWAPQIQDTDSNSRQTEGDSFQMDFIIVKEQEFSLYLFYLSYNDLGAIIGNIFSQYNFKFGQNGLEYKLLKKDNPCENIGTVLVTKNPIEIMETLGISVDIYKRYYGLAGGEVDVSWSTLFDWVTSSYLFKPEFFLPHSDKWNNTARTRARKRQMFPTFINDYIPSKYKIETGFELGDVKTKVKIVDPSVKYEVAKTITERFGISKKIEEMYEIDSKRTRAKLMFNGATVNMITGLSGKELGRYMSHITEDLKDTIGSLEWLSSTDRDKEEIINLVKEYHCSQ